MACQVILLAVLSSIAASRAYPDEAITHRTFLDIEADGIPLGRIIIGLYGKVVPKTVENFRALSTGENGYSLGYKLHYKGSRFTKIIPDFMMHAGDITTGNGQGGISVYGNSFHDENFYLRNIGKGMVGMVSRGRHTNASQFFITTVPADWIDGQFVLFGEVIEGWEVVEAI
jgi:cyclophilin family peptidyl-prolyl cis-trans isomerase